MWPEIFSTNSVSKYCTIRGEKLQSILTSEDISSTFLVVPFGFSSVPLLTFLCLNFCSLLDGYIPCSALYVLHCMFKFVQFIGRLYCTFSIVCLNIIGLCIFLHLRLFYAIKDLLTCLLIATAATGVISSDRRTKAIYNTSNNCRKYCTYYSAFNHSSTHTCRLRRQTNIFSSGVARICQRGRVVPQQGSGSGAPAGSRDRAGEAESFLAFDVPWKRQICLILCILQTQKISATASFIRQ